MVLDALRDRRHRRRRGVQLGNRQAGGLHDLIHVFLALELAALGAGELLRVDLEAHGPAGPLLRRGDGVAQKLLALCVAAILADVERQVHAYIGEVHQDGEPGLGRDLAHAPEHDLVFTRDALKGARARYIRRLIRRGGSGHGIVKLLRTMLHAVDRLGRAHRRAQAALTAGIEHVDAAVLNLDGIHRTDLHACPARALSRPACKARERVGPRLLLVVCRVPLALLGLGIAQERIRKITERLGNAAQALGDIDDVIEHVALLRHASSSP